MTRVSVARRQEPFAVLVFAKAPVAGRVKTRLIPALGAEGASRLQAALFDRLIDMLLEGGRFAVEIWCAPDSAHPLFQRRLGHPLVSLHRQQGADLGERMSRAAADALTRHRGVALVGADCPALEYAMIETAARRLATGDEAVMIPAEDGGYVMLALGRHADCLFDGLPWGTDRVAGLTRQCLDHAGWRWSELPPLWDLDRPEDLRRLARLDGWMNSEPLREAGGNG